MPRVKLDYPDQVFTFSTETDIRFSDVNLGAHLGNDAVVSLFGGDARSRYFAELDRVEAGPPEGDRGGRSDGLLPGRGLSA